MTYMIINNFLTLCYVYIIILLIFYKQTLHISVFVHQLDIYYKKLVFIELLNNFMLGHKNNLSTKAINKIYKHPNAEK